MGDTEIWSFLIGCVIGFVIGFLICQPTYQQRIFELGSSICEQEYHMNFESYDSKELTCVPKEIAKSYDGIAVKLDNIKEEKGGK